MAMLSEDDLNLRDMSASELDAAWDLWFDLAQTTNDSDPLYTHGVFAYGEQLQPHDSGAAKATPYVPLTRGIPRP